MDFTTKRLPIGHETLTWAERKMSLAYQVHKYRFSTGGSQLGGQFPLFNFTGLKYIYCTFSENVGNLLCRKQFNNLNLLNLFVFWEYI